MKVKSLSRVRLLATPWSAAHHAPPSMGFSRQEYWSGVPLPSPQACLLFSLYSSQETKKEKLILLFSFSLQAFNEYSGLISFRIDWFDLLAVQGTLRSFPHHHNLKASILQCSTFFIVCLSHMYMTTGKTIALTIWIFVGKVISLLFNMLFRFVFAFLPRSMCLLIPWLQSLLAVIFGAQANKIYHCFLYFLIYLPQSGWDQLP